MKYSEIFERIEINPKKEKPNYELGELHCEPVGCWLDIRKIPNAKETRIFGILNEVYKKTDVSEMEQLLIELSEYLQNHFETKISTKDFEIRVKKGDYIQSANYNPFDKKIYLFINEKCLQHIREYKNILNILNRMKALFTHEDTHKQQDKASDGKFFNLEKYVIPYDEKSEIKYINQRVEIDAYARQYGFELRELYPKDSTDDLFKRIFSLDIKDNLLRGNIDFLLNHLTIENQKFFLRNIYDYLENE